MTPDLNSLVFCRITKHSLTLNGKAVINYDYRVFKTESEYLKFRKEYKFTFNSRLNSIKKLSIDKVYDTFSHGTSICNGKPFNWIRGMSKNIHVNTGKNYWIDLQWI